MCVERAADTAPVKAQDEAPLAATDQSFPLAIGAPTRFPHSVHEPS